MFFGLFSSKGSFIIYQLLSSYFGNPNFANLTVDFSFWFYLIPICFPCWNCLLIWVLLRSFLTPVELLRSPQCLSFSVIVDFCQNNPVQRLFAHWLIGANECNNEMVPRALPEHCFMWKRDRERFFGFLWGALPLFSYDLSGQGWCRMLEENARMGWARISMAQWSRPRISRKERDPRR